MMHMRSRSRPLPACPAIFEWRTPTHVGIIYFIYILIGVSHNRGSKENPSIVGRFSAIFIRLALSVLSSLPLLHRIAPSLFSGSPFRSLLEQSLLHLLSTSLVSCGILSSIFLISALIFVSYFFPFSRASFLQLSLNPRDLPSQAPPRPRFHPRASFILLSAVVSSLQATYKRSLLVDR